MPYFTNAGLKLYYEEYGQGEPLILIHGTPTDHTIWLYQIAYFSDHYRVIAHDQRCFGRSDKPEEFSLKNFGDDVNGLLEHLKIRKAHIVGVSTGGIAAQYFALNQQEKVKSLVLSSCSPSFRGFKLLDSRVEAIVRGGLRAYLDSVLPSMFGKRFRESALGHFFLKLLGDKAQRLKIQCIRQLYRASEDHHLTEDLGKIRVPTLIITGTEDYTMRECKVMAGKIRGSTLLNLEGVGHTSPVEQPDVFNEALIQHFKKAET